MNWLALIVICMNILAIQARRRHGNFNVRNVIDFIRRRQFDNGRYGAPVFGSSRREQPFQRRQFDNGRYGAPVFGSSRREQPFQRRQFDNGRYGAPNLGSPRHPEHLPAAEPVYPGHSLIKPARGHLKSSFKYPLRDVKNTLVYGNPSTLGIKYGNENERIRYSDFRRGRSTDKLLVELAQILQNHKRKRNKSPIEAIISLSSEENDAREVLDIMDSNSHDLRRRDKTHFRKRSNEGGNDNDDDDDDDDSSASDEANPGNPYTIHTNKYKQNFMWNHAMDGDHMNINPLGPEFKNYGPSGFDLFLGRKWWYFNQDDYKPMS